MSTLREPVLRVALAMEYLWDGRSVAWVAREFGFETSNITHLANMLGLKGKRNSPRLHSLDTYDKVEQALLEEWPIGEICKTFGVYPQTVDAWFPDRKKMSPQQIGDLAQIYEQSRKAREKWRNRI